MTTTRDNGPGSLRDAVRIALVGGTPAVITFDPAEGRFAEPRTIKLLSDLPPIDGPVTIDGYIPDRLWQDTGVRLVPAKQSRLFHVTAGGKLTLRHITLAEGRGDRGGAILNEGELDLDSVSVLDGRATDAGGGVFNLAGRFRAVNSTFAANHAAGHGGAIASRDGSIELTHCTLAGNAATLGGALHAAGGQVRLRNSILADSTSGHDCVALDTAVVDSAYTLIEDGVRCGEPFSRADPSLGPLGLYNGPTPTLPLEGISPAINQADPAAAVGLDGGRLEWDQRGNGDPRFVAGVPDLGAFERQASTRLVVDRATDEDVRVCASEMPGDCSLRGAIHLAQAGALGETVTFDPRVFREGDSISLSMPLPKPSGPIVLDARGTGGIRIALPPGAGRALGYTLFDVEFVNIDPSRH